MINGRKILDTHYGRESEAHALFSSFFFIFVGCCSLSRKDWCQTKLFLVFMKEHVVRALVVCFNQLGYVWFSFDSI